MKVQEASKITPLTAIGIDLGIKTLAHTSNDQIIDNPKYLTQSEKKLAKAQQEVSRKQRGSNNRGKAKAKVRKIHRKIANQRKNNLHQISCQITNDNDLICMETLNVKGMMANHCLAKAIGQIGWGMLKQYILYKAKLKGKTVVQIDRFAPSSKTCCGCGCIKDNLTLGDRTFKCEHCGLVIDRDLNAAINILMMGYKDYCKNTVGTTGIYACGGVNISDPISYRAFIETLNQETQPFRNE